MIITDNKMPQISRINLIKDMRNIFVYDNKLNTFGLYYCIISIVI